MWNLQCQWKNYVNAAQPVFFSQMPQHPCHLGELYWNFWEVKLAVMSWFVIMIANLIRFVNMLWFAHGANLDKSVLDSLMWGVELRVCVRVLLFYLHFPSAHAPFFLKPYHTRQVSKSGVYMGLYGFMTSQEVGQPGSGLINSSTIWGGWSLRCLWSFRWRTATGKWSPAPCQTSTSPLETAGLCSALDFQRWDGLKIWACLKDGVPPILMVFIIIFPVQIEIEVSLHVWTKLHIVDHISHIQRISIRFYSAPVVYTYHHDVTRRFNHTPPYFEQTQEHFSRFLHNWGPPKLFWTGLGWLHCVDLSKGLPLVNES